MSLQTWIFIIFGQIPYFKKTVISRRYYFTLRFRKFNHSYTRIMFSYHCSFMIIELTRNRSMPNCQIIRAGDNASLVGGPVETKDGFEVKTLDVIDGRYLLKSIFGK